MKVIAFLVRSKLWVAAAAAGMTYEAFELFNSRIYYISVVHVFFLTLGAYHFLDTSEFRWRKIFIYIAATGSAIGFLLNPLINLPALIVGALIVLTYQSEWIRQLGVSFFFEWRRVPMLKNIAIASCWILLTVMSALPPFEQYEAPHVLYLIGNFLFILALSIAEDIADSGNDEFPTLVAATGLKGARMVGIFSLMIAGGCYYAMAMNPGLWGAYLSSAIGIFLLSKIQPYGNRDAKGFCIDGVIAGRALTDILR